MTVNQTGKASANIKFGTDGWRALTTEEFTDVNVDLVARAICSHVIKQGGRGRGLVVGYDTRAGSRRFAEICAARAIEHGIPVFMPQRPIPTPVTAFAITHHETAGGFMITASHNPPDYNGIKFISPMGGPSGPEVTQAIEFEIEDVRDRDGVCAPPALDKDSELLQGLTVLPAYKRQLAELVDFEAIRKAAPRVAVDPMHGAGYGILSDLLTEIGCEVLALRDTADSSFGGSMPDPTPELLAKVGKPLSELVDALPEYHFGMEEVYCPWDHKGRVMRMVAEQSKDKELLLLDGVKIIDDGDWALVLPDPEEPYVYVCADGSNDASTDEMLGRFGDMVKDIVAGKLEDGDQN